MEQSVTGNLAGWDELDEHPDFNSNNWGADSSNFNSVGNVHAVRVFSYECELLFTQGTHLRLSVKSFAVISQYFTPAIASLCHFNLACSTIPSLLISTKRPPNIRCSTVWQHVVGTPLRVRCTLSPNAISSPPTELSAPDSMSCAGLRPCDQEMSCT